MDRPTVKRLREQLQAILSLDGYQVEVGNARYGGTNVTFKLTVSEVANDGTVLSPAAVDFQSYATAYGLKPSDLGAEFTSNGERFRITGLASRSRKYPILVDRVSDGRGLKYPAEVVAMRLRMERERTAS